VRWAALILQILGESIITFLVLFRVLFVLDPLLRHSKTVMELPLADSDDSHTHGHNEHDMFSDAAACGPASQMLCLAWLKITSLD
jgi:hypothetical protein